MFHISGESGGDLQQLDVSSSESKSSLLAYVKRYPK